MVLYKKLPRDPRVYKGDAEIDIARGDLLPNVPEQEQGYVNEDIASALLTTDAPLPTDDWQAALLDRKAPRSKRIADTKKIKRKERRA